MSASADLRVLGDSIRGDVKAACRLVPVTAVGVGPNGATVMIVKPDGLVSQVPVQTGIRDQGMVEILTGVQAGDRVVTKAAAFVRDGDHVNPVLAGTQ